jgi:hypothetical protein
MTPNIDRNEAPETWITAAPVDTLTIKDSYGRPEGDPPITTIPVRFHLYWAASDKDGAVAGFYYAVVETTATPVDGVYAPLPGPKPGDYRYTTKTDTTFIFTVSELFTDRRHAFYIYSVDNNGKADPSPARFIFTAQDRFPPRPVIDVARSTGKVVDLTYDGDPVPRIVSYDVTDTFNINTEPRDTVSANSRMDFNWHSMITLAGAYVTNYRYKLDESSFQDADSSVHSKTYAPPLSPGVKIFNLRALDQAQGAGETTRRFYMNFAPDTWWAGPDPAYFTQTDGEYNSHCINVITWPKTDAVNPVFVTDPQLPVTQEGGTFGPDSLSYRPSKRYPPHHEFRYQYQKPTFYEIYGNRLYARSDGDTVHMNSFVVLWNGGYDKDSQYQVYADTFPDGSFTDPVLAPSGGTALSGPVLKLTEEERTQMGGIVGSPVGFRSMLINKLTPAGLKVPNAQTSVYPVYSPSSVYRSPRMGGYWRMVQAGKSYAIARAEDLDGTLDHEVADPVALADAVDGGGGTTREQQLRRKVLVFYVDKAPALVRGDTSEAACAGATPPLFQPCNGKTMGAVWDFALYGMDLDPYNPTDPNVGSGGPTETKVIRFRIDLYGTGLDGKPVSYTYKAANNSPYLNQGSPVNLQIVLSSATSPFQSGPVLVSVEICDCSDCGTTPGQGRCVNGIDPDVWEYLRKNDPDHLDQAVVNPYNVIRVNYVRPASPEDGASSTTNGRPGPGTSGRGE